MGDPRKKRKQYEKPKKVWDKKRIEEEKALREEFGLKNARELWRMQTILRKTRREARRLLSRKGKNIDERTRRLLNRVKSFLLNKSNATLDDVLTLGVRDILARRLQSIVFKKRLAKTMKQARQFIAHGHIAVGGKKISAPSYLVKFGEEESVGWFKKPVLEGEKGEKEEKEEFKESKESTKREETQARKEREERGNAGELNG